MVWKKKKGDEREKERERKELNVTVTRALKTRKSENPLSLSPTWSILPFLTHLFFAAYYSFHRIFSMERERTRKNDTESSHRERERGAKCHSVEGSEDEAMHSPSSSPSLQCTLECLIQESIQELNGREWMKETRNFWKRIFGKIRKRGRTRKGKPILPIVSNGRFLTLTDSTQKVCIQKKGNCSEMCSIVNSNWIEFLTPKTLLPLLSLSLSSKFFSPWFLSKRKYHEAIRPIDTSL